MKKNGKIMALALSAVMAFGLTGCGSSGSQDAGTTAPAKEEAAAAGEAESSCRVVGATYANGWLIIVGASKTSSVPGNGMRRRHARRWILPRFGALREIIPLVLLCGVSA